MFGKKESKIFLDRELCFNVWLETGSVWKAPKILKDKHGIYNKKTGELASAMGIWRAAWMYAFDNLAQAREKVSKVWLANGVVMTDKDWYTLVVGKAKYLYSQRRFKKFMEEHLYLAPYNV